jgi:hypothetical protein
MSLERCFKILAAAALICFLAFTFYMPIEFEDGWWHLAAGRWIVGHHAVPHQDPFTFSPVAAPWILTQWLGSTSYYLAYLGGGYEGLKIFRMFLFLIIMGIFLHSSRRHLPFPLLILLSYFLYHALQTRSFLRPDVFNYIFIQLLLIQIFAYGRDRDFRRLWWVPVLGVLWGNLHLGSFVFGGLLIGIVLASSAIAMFNGYLEPDAQKLKMFADDFKRYAMILIVYLASLAVSPYGLSALVYPFKVFFFPDFINFYKFNDIILEQVAPTYLWTWAGLWASCLTAGGVVAVILTKRDKVLTGLLFIIPLFLFLHGRRGSAFFALAAVYVIAECARELSLKLRWESWRPSKAVNSICSVFFVLFFAFLCIKNAEARVYYAKAFHPYRTENFELPRPVPAVDFLLKHKIAGRVLTNDTMGGYVIWAGYPQLKPLVDGRQLDQTAFKDWWEVTRDPSRLWNAVEKKYNINIVLLDTSRDIVYGLAAYLANHERWQLVFIDGPCLVFVLRNSLDLPADVTHLDIQLRSVPLAWEDVRALRKRISGPLVSIVNPPFYVADFQEAATLFGIGFRGEGIHRLLQSYDLNPQVARKIGGGMDDVLSHEMH